MKHAKSRVDYEAFVRVWTKSPSAYAVAAALGISYGAACMRATYLRRRGVRLKHMPNHGNPKHGVVVARLNRIAEGGAA